MESLQHDLPAFILEQPSLQTSQPRKRFKESCDNCGLSKVKCSKDRPTCARCVERGIRCFYSQSQRLKRSQGSESTWTTNAVHNLPLDEFFKTDLFLGDPTFLWDDCPLMDVDSNDNTGNFHDLTPDPLPTSYFPTTFERSLSPASSKEIPAPTPSSFEGISSILSANGTVPVSAPASPSPIRKTNPKLSRCKTISNDEPHEGLKNRDCMNLALELLGILQTSPTMCGYQLRSNTPISQASQPLIIDEVNSINQATIDSLTLILQCSCSHDPQFQILLTFLICKIMEWHKAIIPSSPPPEALTPSTRDGSHHSARAKDNAGHDTLPIHKYHLESNLETDGTKIRAQLVLSKLHQVIRLMEQLVSCFRDSKNETSDASASSNFDRKAPSSMGASLEAFMRQRVRVITQEIVKFL